MARLCVRCSSTESRPAANARTLLPVPAGSAQAHDADGGVGQQVDGDALLRGPASHVEQRSIAACQVDPLVGVHASECRLLGPCVEHDAGVAGKVACLGQVGDMVGEQRVDDAPLHVDLDDTAPAGIDRQLVAVLVGLEPDDGRLELQR